MSKIYICQIVINTAERIHAGKIERDGKGLVAISNIVVKKGLNW